MVAGPGSVGELVVDECGDDCIGGGVQGFFNLVLSA